MMSAIVKVLTGAISNMSQWRTRVTTGNQGVDLILGGLISICMIQILQLLKDGQTRAIVMRWLPTWFEPLFFDRASKGEIEFLIEQVNQVSNCFTPTYRAIMYKLSTIRDEQVWRLKERHLEWYDNSVDKTMTESMYSVLQAEPICVEDNVWVRCEERTEERPNNMGNQVMSVVTYRVYVYSMVHTVHYLKKVVDRWLKEYKHFKKKQLTDSQLIFTVRFQDDSSETEDIQYSTFKTARSFDNLFFETKDEILTELNFFLNEKEWLRKRGLPDSLGILCYGDPGCGKTSFIKALLRLTGRHGVLFSVNRRTKLESIERLMRSETLCDFPIPQNQRVYILEDIDAMGSLVRQRQPTGVAPSNELDPVDAQEEPPRTGSRLLEREFYKWIKFGLPSKSSEHHLGFFLNLLDGLVETSGRIVVMSTNYIEHLDPALIRPGRVDIRIEFVKCSRKTIKAIMSHFYSRKEHEWCLDDVIGDYEISPAELTQICRANKFDFEVALEALYDWARRKGHGPD